ncbi:unnamed protein product [Allacma fusca]|uniref:Helitron helicase-like domain-containing protein n=1 Tax=Allacma fusca TaxID=39272 RepID=A0A8J2KPF4_9HEXA|nr:unnamed protein product [Allacma fusca]
MFARERNNEFDMSHVIPELPTNCKVTQLMFSNRVLSVPVIRPDVLNAVSHEIVTYMYYNDGDEQHVLRRRPNILNHPDIWRGQFVVTNEPLAIDDDDDHDPVISPASTVTLPKVSLPVRISVHRIHERLDMEGADIVRCFHTVFRSLAEMPTGTLKQVFRFELMSGVNRTAATNLHFLFLAFKMTLTKEIDDALEKLKRKGPVTTKRVALRNYVREFPRTQMYINTHLSIRNDPLYWRRYRGKVHMMAKEFDHSYFEFFGRSFQDLDWKHKTALLSSEPVLVAKYFETRCKAMMSLMKTHRTPWGRNNETVHFVSRTERTRRGNPHMHMLAWISMRRLESTTICMSMCPFHASASTWLVIDHDIDNESSRQNSPKVHTQSQNDILVLVLAYTKQRKERVKGRRGSDPRIVMSC